MLTVWTQSDPQLGGLRPQFTGTPGGNQAVMAAIPAVAKPRSWIERLAGCILSAIVIGRLLTPTDAAPAGETLWLAQLSLLGFLVWGVAAWRSQHVVGRFNWVDAAAGLLCLGHVIGALLVIATSGDKRAAVTMLWEWVGLAVTWFLLRRLLESSAERQGMLVVVTATVRFAIGFGNLAASFWLPSTREYEKLKTEYADPAIGTPRRWSPRKFQQTARPESSGSNACIRVSRSECLH